MIVIWILLIILAIPAIIALFIPKEYVVEALTIVNKSKHEVFDYIKYINNQEEYSKWVKTDPNIKKTLTGVDGTVGYIYAWNGNSKAGEGEQEITGIIDGERITTEVRFVRPFKSIAHFYMTTEAESEHSTKVVWHMTGKSPYPLNLMTALMKNALRNDMSISLNDLKKILESK
ncbi:SRPBCC family protein [Flavobacterium suzhouense]|uniref:SRPBCC family protein n=1 Tax=Flavobacterium suzhouense TaxID=1529638 RepID=A0ABW5NS74_9FLAO